MANGGTGFLSLDEIRLNPFMAIAYCDDNRSCWFVAASTREKAVAKVHELKHQLGVPEYLVVAHFKVADLELYFAHPANYRPI
ncbi:MULTISPECIES: hypothetical protein [Bradyrhizobium]|uniref:hypothetical protein n=1 Tax=Bradyrhizobium TaxID=374 RepID=UPI00140B1689|nr:MULTISPECIES: hypothetical protein [Bradyrhizobium]MCK7669179.1 hypothetical protein [Bradyrhizobium sp. 2S1]UGY23773.1 hypothetical protein HU675_0038475 [Bradyrhizobium septentrionale]